MFGEREDDAPLQLERENLKVGGNDFSGWLKADNLNILMVVGWVQGHITLRSLSVCLYFMYMYLHTNLYIYI